MGLYTAFLDVAMDSPTLGLVAGLAGLKSVFLVSAVIVLGAAGIAIRLRQHTSSLACAACLE